MKILKTEFNIRKMKKDINNVNSSSALRANLSGGADTVLFTGKESRIVLLKNKAVELLKKIFTKNKDYSYDNLLNLFGNYDAKIVVMHKSMKKAFKIPWSKGTSVFEFDINGNPVLFSHYNKPKNKISEGKMVIFHERTGLPSQYGDIKIYYNHQFLKKDIKYYDCNDKNPALLMQKTFYRNGTEKRMIFNKNDPSTCTVETYNEYGSLLRKSNKKVENV